jgi:ribosome-binding factor A
VSSDVAHAQVFYTVLPDDDDTRASTAAGLSSAVPAVQRELGQKLRTRNTPAVQFIDDPVAVHSRRIEDLIRGTQPTDGASEPPWE